MESSSFYERLYEKRFAKKLRQRREIWKVLCSSFFQQYVKETDAVLDLGAGYCEFINNIRAGRKIAVDRNRRTKDFAAPGVEVYNLNGTDLTPIPPSSIDVVFMSNFLEHSESKNEMLTTLEEVGRVLRPGGRAMVLQPNIRFTYREYWDYFDHYIPLSDRSMCEALETMGFDVEEVIPRFLPYSFDSFKGGVLYRSFFAKAYLTLPVFNKLFWRLLGRQMFVVCRKRA